MNRAEFMSDLTARLRYLPAIDLQAALQYYEEYFDEAGAANEQEVIRELRSPAHVAAKILSDYAVKKAEIARYSTKSGWHAFWFTILAICAAPVAVPLIIAAVVSVIALGITGIAIVFALGVAAAFALVKAITLFTVGSASALVFLGIVLVAIGGMVLVFYIIGALVSCIGRRIKSKSDGQL